MKLEDLRSQVRQRLNIENATHITDSELNRYLNFGLAEHRELVIEAGEEWGIKRALITLPAFNSNADDGYALPSDLYKILRLDKNYGNNNYGTLNRINTQDEASYRDDCDDYGRDGNSGYVYNTEVNVDGITLIRIFPQESSNGNYRLIYYPQWVDKVDGYEFQIGPSGQHWEEYAIVDTCIKCCAKDETDGTEFKIQKQAMIDRINNAASSRDAGQGVPIPRQLWFERRRR